ncbi:MAG: branched-chain amino acid transport system II carrier protein [Helcococcus sp.]|nr:branched-chain amino acid transport system II carrier protein [Helcococcus sp.]
MKRNLTRREFISIALLLFSMFFGSGNLIFPPMLGHLAGPNMWKALFGFTLTAIIFPILGIIAVIKADGPTKLSRRVGPLFAIIYPILIYLSVGPGIAIPRNASLAFEMSLGQYFQDNPNIKLWLLVYTVVFFAIALFLSLQPSKLVDRLGKALTPILLILIVLLFFGAVFRIPINIGSVDEAYQRPIIKGFIEGYNTMDGLVSINFGVVILLTFNNYMINKESDKIKYTTHASLISGGILFTIYAMISYIGMITSNSYSEIKNGGEVLFRATNEIFGAFGLVVIGFIFTLACLTTAVGLITSVGQYFAEITKIKYPIWAIFFALISLILANFGLNEILKFSVPVLIALNPVALVIILLCLFQDVFKFKRITYKFTIYTTAIISIIQGLKAYGIKSDFLNGIFSQFPFYNYSLEWVVPAFVMMLISLIFGKFFNTEEI